MSLRTSADDHDTRPVPGRRMGPARLLLAAGLLAGGAVLGTAAPASACAPPPAMLDTVPGDGAPVESAPPSVEIDPESALDQIGCASEQTDAAVRFAEPWDQYPATYVHPYVEAAFPHLNAQEMSDDTAMQHGGLRFVVLPAATETPLELAESMIEANPDLLVAAAFVWDGERFRVGVATQPDAKYPGELRARLLPESVDPGQLTGEMAALNEPYGLVLKYASSGLRQSWVFYGYNPDPTLAVREYTPGLPGGHHDLVAQNNAMSALDHPVRVAFLPESQAETLMAGEDGGRADTAAFLRELKKVPEPVVAYFVNAQGRVVGVSTDGAVPAATPGEGDDELARRATAAISDTGPMTFDALVVELAKRPVEREPRFLGLPFSAGTVLGYASALAGVLVLLTAGLFALRRRRGTARSAAERTVADTALERRRAKVHEAIDRAGEQLSAAEAPGSGAEAREFSAVLNRYQGLRDAVDAAVSTDALADLLIEVNELQALISSWADEKES